MALAGVIGGLVVYIASPAIVRALQMPAVLSSEAHEQLQTEALGAFVLMAIGLPVLTSTAGLRGVLEAHQKFFGVAVVQLWHGIWTFLGPLLVAWLIKPDLSYAVGGLLAGRLVTWIAYFSLATRAAPQVWSATKLDASTIKPLLSYGGWMTLTHAVVPVLLYGDRFIIGSIIDTEAVAHYVTPAEMVVKLLIVPNAIMGVLFPAFAATYEHHREQTRKLFSHGLKTVLLLFVPVGVMGVALGPELMAVWLRMGMHPKEASSFALIAAPVLQLLIVGVLINGLAQIPTALIQAVGRPSWVAITYCIELPIWGMMMMWLTQQYGVTGAAVAWCLRQVIDASTLLLLAQTLTGEGKVVLFKRITATGVASLALLGLMVIDPLWGRASVGAVLLLLAVWLGWTVVLDAEQRNGFKHLLRKRLSRGIVSEMEPWMDVDGRA
jgi:O-antigen/teichoic acid export membrane protein